MHEYGVLIGRFQPFHNAHLDTVRFAFKHARNLIIVIGSHNRSSDVRNPWSSEKRSQMIRACLSKDENARVDFVCAKDYDYNNLLWVADVQEAIHERTDGSSDIKLIGHRKDSTSFYLKLFPQWGEHIETNLRSDIDATKIRELLFRLDKIGIRDMVPSPVYDDLVAFMATPEFERLHNEYQDVIEKRAAWDGAPRRPIFVTTDAVVVCSGHVLVVKRGGRYGRGLIALPGGYLNESESLVDGCIRELKEETGIKVDAKELKRLIVDRDVFDHPQRDLRGRVITHAYCIKLPDGELPRVKGMDDAAKAWWMSIRDVFASEPRFFSDHFHIINRFALRGI